MGHELLMRTVAHARGGEVGVPGEVGRPGSREMTIGLICGQIGLF